MSNQSTSELRPLDLACKHVGGYSDMAKRIGVSSSAPHMWRARGMVPSDHCAAIEQACGGVVRRWHLRPSDWHRIWPELVGADGAPAIDVTKAPDAAQEVRHAA